jgi:hypothetical protein
MAEDTIAIKTSQNLFVAGAAAPGMIESIMNMVMMVMMMGMIMPMMTGMMGEDDGGL